MEPKTTDLRGLPLLAYILDNVENGTLPFNQKKWGKRDTCNTSYCVAGWAAVLTGASMEFTRSKVDGYYYATSCMTPNGHFSEISGYARKVLGLSESDSDILFWWSNSFEDLRMFQKLLEGGISLREYQDS
jgi:hypothetical protein